MVQKLQRALALGLYEVLNRVGSYKTAAREIAKHV
jgi:hypothetical protein